MKTKNRIKRLFESSTRCVWGGVSVYERERESSKIDQDTGFSLYHNQLRVDRKSVV